MGKASEYQVIPVVIKTNDKEYVEWHALNTSKKIQYRNTSRDNVITWISKHKEGN